MGEGWAMKFDKILLLIAPGREINDAESLVLTPCRRGYSQKERLSLANAEEEWIRSFQRSTPVTSRTRQSDSSVKSRELWDFS
ncbi:hypothetical protein TIFTF001_027307 [Ficus carica]|uniref:Uncharacterized protein n=1 Tax=Ficus carica TaxID=3494 RepID=A0AA88IZF0_FICCA|nr:hypothetical protein TIFTF001_027307 [Ficus carica]